VTSPERVGEPSRRIPFHVPSIGEEEIAEVVDTLRSGWLTTGPKTKRFEQEFAAYVGARHAIAVNSCTAALHLGLEAVGVRAGDEVIIPTYTFTATGEVVTYLGARPVLADVRGDTFNLDATTIEPLITPRTRAVVPVHIAGQLCDMDPILDLARRHGLRVVDDAAHTLPAIYRGRPIGGLADATTFSFYATKTITTGEGGMVTTDRDDLATRMKSMSLHGLSGDAWNRYTDRGSWYYEVLDFGFKYNLTDIAAALGLQQLRRAEAFHKRRREIALRYSEAFAGLDECSVPVELDYGTHAWHLYVLLVNPEALAVGRDDVIRALGAAGIGTSVHFIPLHLHPAYQKAFGYRPGAFPVAEGLFERAISLPIYPSMSDAAVTRVIDTVRDVLGRARR
jgi:perosamine synthetase